MRVLALDVATVTGFAVDRPAGGDAPTTGAFRVKVVDEDLGAAFLDFEERVEDLIAVHQPAVLAFEAPLVIGGGRGTTRPTNHNTIRLLFGLAAIAELVGTRRQLRVFEAHIGTVRRHFCGSGRADKADVMARCRLLGWDVKTNDAADGAAIWDFARHTLRRPTSNAGPLLGRASA